MAAVLKSVGARRTGAAKMRRVGALGLSATLLAAVSGTAEISASATPTSALNSVLSEVRPDGMVPDAFGPHLVALKTPPVGPYLAVLKNDEGDIASHIGHPLGIPLSVVVNSKQVGPTALAYTYAYDSKGDLTGRPASCVIYINPLLYHSVDSSQVNVTLMHEMFHCFQATDYSTLTAFYDAPRWLIEGSAEWVGETLAPSQPDVLWQNYLLDIGKSLFNRTYDAIGFYAHMEETGIDPWHLFDRMFRAPTSAAAYAIATDREFKLTWASSLLRHPDFGDGWDLTGPAIPDIAFNPTVHVLGLNQSLKGTVAAYANDIVGVNTAANTLEFVVSTPYSRLHDSTSHDFDNLQSGALTSSASTTAVLRPSSRPFPALLRVRSIWRLPAIRPGLPMPLVPATTLPASSATGSLPIGP